MTTAITKKLVSSIPRQLRTPCPRAVPDGFTLLAAAADPRHTAAARPPPPQRARRAGTPWRPRRRTAGRYGDWSSLFRRWPGPRPVGQPDQDRVSGTRLQAGLAGEVIAMAPGSRLGDQRCQHRQRLSGEGCATRHEPNSTYVEPTAQVVGDPRLADEQALGTGRQPP